MIFVTGDCHGDWTGRFSTHRFPEQKEMTREDFVIVCGDFGIWHDDAAERYWLNWLAEKPFTVLFVDGNHENFDRLYSDEFEIVDFHGGKAHKIRDNIYHLMRGYVFELEGKKFFAMGGASSHDIQDGIVDLADFENQEELRKYCKKLVARNKMFRVNHLSWWKEELPSVDEMMLAIENLQKHDFKVDYVITHCLPQGVACLFSAGLYKADCLTNFFNQLIEDCGLQFDKWYCGHYHINDDIFNEYIIKYDNIERIA